MSNESKTYSSDSAFHYLYKNLALAKHLHNFTCEVETLLEEVYLLTCVGMYLEAKDMLSKIDRSTLPSSLLGRYYMYCKRLFFETGVSLPRNKHTSLYYRNIGLTYRDSILQVLSPTDDAYLSEKMFQAKEIRDYQKALYWNDKRMESATFGTSFYALVTYDRSGILKTIGVLTSGGDAPGMNAAIRAVVRTALNKGLKVKGIQKGYNGLLNDEIIDMDKRSVADIIQRGGTVLYTARCMEFMTEEGQKRGAEVCRKHGIDGIVVIGGDGSFRGAQKLAAQGINTIGLPGTIDLDIACTDYTIGFDTAVNTAMEAIDKIRDTSTSHERCSIIEVMGRNAGYIALWCGIANGAEDILLPERYDNDEQTLINHIIEGRKKGKKHHLIINAEGIGHSTGMARRIEAATGIETRATILGYMQRGGSPTCKDRMYASIMGAYAVDLLAEGKSNRLVAYRDGKFVDYDIDEALAMTKDINDYEFNISALLSK